MNTNVTYSISEIAVKTGINKHRIRDWDIKGFLPEVHWISFGVKSQRRFTQKDLLVIEGIKKYIEQGFILSVAAKKAKEELNICD